MADDVLASLLDSPIASHLIHSHAASLSRIPSPAASVPTSTSTPSHPKPSEILPVALAALAAFLQANVTGPVLPERSAHAVETLFAEAFRSETWSREQALRRLRGACLAYLEVDGVCPYAYIPRLELFSLAKFLVESISITESIDPSNDDKDKEDASEDIVMSGESLAWTRLRVDAWHYRILTQPSLGGANFNKSAQWIDVPTLAAKILSGIDGARGTVSSAQRGLFLVEAASHYIALGRRDQAKEALGQAVAATGFTYALTGALGKRTRFQENDISQLVVMAKSADHESPPSIQDRGHQEKGEERPDAVPLNDDTLLEEIQFVSVDDQPQLEPLDAIVLLAEATIRDAFSPSDGLTAEQILPFASRVIADRAVNWQIYTQALLVRSRIEAHRSRTVERGVLQLQAVADQVIADTSAPTSTSDSTSQEQKPELPVIQIGEAAPVDASKPTTFLPAPKQGESAPSNVRLRYIHALSSPPRWHLEAELAYAWAGIGSMASALDIFKRLRLWAEVALCLASTAAARADEGKASSGEEHARAVLRWRLFSRTSSPTSKEPDHDKDEDVDIAGLKVEDWAGIERSPPPPDAPRLWCILGDIESNPSHYERAWSLSKHRYARAQRSLGEHHVRLSQWPLALAAYRLATHANRMSPDAWGRLGDIALRLGLFEEAAQAFTRSIGTASDTAGGEGARTWSNLGSALWSLYLERTSGPHPSSSSSSDPATEENEEEKEDEVAKDPSKLIRQALSAYKRGAAIAHDNWRIWDNVLTLSARIHPPPLSDMLLSLTHILRIRRSESALDVSLLAALLQDAVLSKPKPSTSEDQDLPRGSAQRSVNLFFEEQVVPLITTRSELWTLVARLRSWKGDHPAALDASEKAWRCALGSSAGGLVPDSNASQDWTQDQPAWEEVVARTDELVSMLENWGPGVEGVGEKWRGKARSAVRSVMGRGRENWEGSEGWKQLEAIMEGLK